MAKDKRGTLSDISHLAKAKPDDMSSPSDAPHSPKFNPPASTDIDKLNVSLAKKAAQSNPEQDKQVMMELAKNWKWGDQAPLAPSYTDQKKYDREYQRAFEEFLEYLKRGVMDKQDIEDYFDKIPAAVKKELKLGDPRKETYESIKQKMSYSFAGMKKISKEDWSPKTLKQYNAVKNNKIRREIESEQDPKKKEEKIKSSEYSKLAKILTKIEKNTRDTVEIGRKKKREEEKEGHENRKKLVKSDTIHDSVSRHVNLPTRILMNAVSSIKEKRAERKNAFLNTNQATAAKPAIEITKTESIGGLTSGLDNPIAKTEQTSQQSSRGILDHLGDFMDTFRKDQNAPKKDKSGRWRTSDGKFTKAPSKATGALGKTLEAGKGMLGKAAPLLSKLAMPLAIANAGMSVFSGVSDELEGKRIKNIQDVVPEGWNVLNPGEWLTNAGRYTGNKITESGKDSQGTGWLDKTSNAVGNLVTGRGLSTKNPVELANEQLAAVKKSKVPSDVPRAEAIKKNTAAIIEKNSSELEKQKISADNQRHMQIVNSSHSNSSTNIINGNSDGPGMGARNADSTFNRFITSRTSFV